MSPRQQILGFSVFALLCSAVVFNAFYLQGLSPPQPRPDAPQSDSRLLLPSPGELTAGPSSAQARTAVPSQTIIAIQRELDQRGYAPGPADATVGAVLRAAILAFESDQGLSLTAEPSDRLLHAIILGPGAGSDAALATSRPGSEAEKLIVRVQRDLTALGYGPFAAPGRLGEDTARAIAKFERDQNVSPSGRISAPLVARLMRVAPQEPKRPLLGPG